MTIHFGYDKKQVIQALRYHFISRPEIRIMIILVNVFAIASLVLYVTRKVTPNAFLIGSLLWLVLLVSFWFILPTLVYRRAITFQHRFSMTFNENGFSLDHEKGGKSWPWKALNSFMESPNFFHFYFDSRSFLLVPKNACADSDEVHKLRQIIQAHVRKGTPRG